MVLWAHPSPHSKWRLEQFHHFCRAHDHERLTNRQACYSICCNRPHLPSAVMWPNNIWTRETSSGQIMHRSKWLWVPASWCKPLLPPIWYFHRGRLGTQLIRPFTINKLQWHLFMQITLLHISSTILQWVDVLHCHQLHAHTPESYNMQLPFKNYLLHITSTKATNVFKMWCGCHISFIIRAWKHVSALQFALNRTRPQAEKHDAWISSVHNH